MQSKIYQMNQQIINIKNYLEQNAIIEFPLLNEEGGEVIFSLPQFDPYVDLYRQQLHQLQKESLLIFL